MSLADDRIDDRDIGPYWAEYFPKRHDNACSKVLCHVLLLMLEHKAQYALTHDAVWSIKLHYTLAKFDVPEDQFYELKKERRQEWLVNSKGR